MGATYSRILKATLLILVALTLAFVPETGFAKKKKKRKKAKKADAAEVAKPEDDSRALAKEHYGKGKGLYDAKNYAEAMAEFQTAYDLKPHPTVLKSVAECKLQLGDIQGARETFEKVLADPATTNKAPIQARIDEIIAMMASIEIITVPEGAGVMLDGAVTDKITPATIELPPGDHELALNIDGYEPLVKSVSLTNGEKAKVEVDFATEGTSSEPEPALVDPFADESGGDVVVGKEEEGPPPAFWVSAAVAGVGLVAGTVFGTMALGDEDDYHANPEDKDIKKTGERNAIIADVSFGVAAAAAVVGIIILVTNKDDESAIDVDTKEAKAKWDVVPTATGNSVGISTAVTF